ncbi:response regulator [Ekhidna sp.]
MSVLIVDDEEDIGLMISVFLKKQGLKTDFSARINSAKEMIEKNNYSIFFLDLNLPDGTGFDLIPLIKQKDPNSGIIVISAYDSADEMKRATDLGSDLFIKKPFSRNEIIGAVNTLYKKDEKNLNH